MNWKNSIVIAAVLFLFSCNAEKDYKQEFFKNTSDEWSAYLNEIGVTATDLRDHVFSIVHSTNCSACLSELSWWNREGVKLKNVELSLIVLEKHKSVFDNFLEANNLTIPAYRDSASLIFKHELIPFPLIKIYFNETAKIEAVESIGTNGKLSEFISTIEQSRDGRNEP